jgi:uncharacterized UBP type Zn finger protein
MLKIIGLCRGRSILLSCYPAKGMNKIMTKQACDHVNNVEENIASRTNGCEEFEKEGTDWVALRMCLSCGQMGCCDSSVGLHATKHFQKTGHPVMIAVPDKSWKWCNVGKEYFR